MFLDSGLKELEASMVRAIQDGGDKMFAETQRLVNVDKGTLKKSGFIEYLRDGVVFGYRAPYARRVNYGVSKGHTEHVRRHTVRAHSVRAHRRSIMGT